MAAQRVEQILGSCGISLTSKQVGGNIFLAGFGDGAVQIYDRWMAPRDQIVKVWKEYKAWIVKVHMQRGIFLPGPRKHTILEMFSVRWLPRVPRKCWGCLKSSSSYSMCMLKDLDCWGRGHSFWLGNGMLISGRSYYTGSSLRRDRGLGEDVFAKETDCN